jgi:nucleolin
MSAADMPTASEIEVSDASTKLSPAESFMEILARLEEKQARAKTLQKEIDSDMNALKKAAKKAVKLPKGSRKGTHPKGETPKQVEAWNNFVKETQQKMIAEGWPSFEVKGKTLPGGIQVDGKWVVDVEDEKKRVAPNFKTAMSYAAYRKANGEYTSPEKPAKEEKPKGTRGRKPKAEKPATGGAGAKSESESESEEEKPAKKASPAKAKANTKAKAKATSESEEEKPAKKTPAKAKAKPAPVAESESESDEETLTPWTYKGKKYYHNADGECWHMNSDGTQGKWAGKYNPGSDKIDASAEEP